MDPSPQSTNSPRPKQPRPPAVSASARFVNADIIDKYHPQHDDPLADVVLVSSNKVAFRVHSHYFKLNSTFASDTFSIPTPTPKSQNRISTVDPAGSSTDTYDLVIKVNADDSILQTYVNYLLTSPDGLPARTWTLSRLIDFERLCEQMQTEALDKHIQHEISSHVMDDPWLAFTYAAGKNDLRLARAAISNFKFQPRSPAMLLPEVPYEDASDIPSEWTYELFRLRGRQIGSSEESMGTNTPSNSLLHTMVDSRAGLSVEKRGR